MAPIKFEENIKEKLDNRTIEPSDAAWEKLADKLDTEKGSTDKKFVWWLGIAASLVGVLLVTTLFFQQNELEITQPIVVDSPINETTEQLEEIQVEKRENIIEEIVTDQDISVPKKSNTSIAKREYAKNKEYQATLEKSLQKDAIASKFLTKDTIQNNDLVNSNAIIKDQNKQEIVANIPALERESSLVTDAEIESLLNKAYVEINSERINNNSDPVDAISLLQDVESDLEQSFRDRVFKTFISSFKTVKTAVADRND